MLVKTIAFKRNKKSQQEVGIEIEGSVIIDAEGKVVPPPIWNAVDIPGLKLDLYPLLKSLGEAKYVRL